MNISIFCVEPTSIGISPSTRIDCSNNSVHSPESIYFQERTSSPRQNETKTKAIVGDNNRGDKVL